MVMMSQSWNAENKNIIITGGASGLGVEYVKVFLQLGAKRIAILDIAEELGKAATESLNKLYGDKVIFIKCDVSKEGNITNAFEAVISQFKQIDVIVNNAGIVNDAPNTWRNACAVNWEGLVSFTLKEINHMRKDEGGAGGTIINVSSMAALTPVPYIPIYSGTKIAVLHFSQSIAMTPFYETTNIRIMTICYGSTDTPILHNVDTKTYCPKLGKVFQEMVNEYGLQKVESAVAAFVSMFENGAPGSIWLSAYNKPVKDITPVINRVFQELANLAN